MCSAPYLRHRHDYPNIAVLLGAAAAAAGTMDTSLSKILRLYLPSLIPGASVNDTVHVTLQVQSAVLVGVGLLYRGSAHRLMTEFLVREIGRRATTDIRMQECYSLSAGLALGLVTLGKGGSGDAAGFGVADLRLLDRLRAYMNGSVSGEPRGGAGDAAGVGANDTDTIHHGAGINVAVAAPELPQPTAVSSVRAAVAASGGDPRWRRRDGSGAVLRRKSSSAAAHESAS